MKPSCPLYYKPTDILAAFSHACERDAPAVRLKPERRFAFGVRLVVTVVGSTLSSRGLIHPRRRTRRPDMDAVVPQTPFREAVAEWTVLRAADRHPPSPYRAGLRSHFALASPFE